MTPLRLLRRYALNVLIGLDQLANAVLGGAPDETISSALGKCARGDYGRTARIVTAPARLAVDAIFALLGEPHHCARSIEDDEGAESIWRLLAAANRE